MNIIQRLTQNAARKSPLDRDRELLTDALDCITTMLNALRAIEGHAHEMVTDIAAEIQSGDTSPATRDALSRWSAVHDAIARATKQ